MVLKFVKLSERGRFRKKKKKRKLPFPFLFRRFRDHFLVLDFFFEHISCATMEYMGRSFDIYSPDGQTILYKVVPWNVHAPAIGNMRLQSAPSSTPSAIVATNRVQ